MAIRILSGENITGDITTSGKVNAGDRILTEATTSNALLQVKYNASNYLEAYYDTLNVVGGDFLIKRVGDTKIRLTAVGTTFTNLSNTSAASSSVDEVKIGTFGAGRPAIFLGSSNTTYTNSTWFIENIGASGKFRIGRNGLDILEIENGGASTFKGPSVTVLNASDPSVAVSDTDTNYKGIMTWRNSGSENVLEFVTRYAGTYYTNNLVLDRGNVAIGTETPDQTGYGYKVLTIMGGTTAGYAGTIELLAPSVDAEGQNYGILSFGAGGTRTAMISANRQAANNAGNLRFWTAPGGAGIQERMRIDKDGNVIIGNTNVDNPNSLDKVLEIEHGGSVGVILNDSRDTPIGLENRGAVFHLTHNTNSRLVVDGASGYVGIGTTLPSAKLQVVGTTGLPATSGTAFTGTMRLNVSGYGTVLDFGSVGPATGTQWLQATNKADLSITYPLLLNPNGGNVGIGETAPAHKLSIKATDDTRGVLVNNTLTTSYAEVALKASREFRMGTGGSASDTSARDRWYVYDLTATAHRLTLDSSGNFGIGTTSPAEKLSVYAGASTGITTIADVLGVYANVSLPQANRGAAIRLGIGPSGAYSTKIATVYEGSSPSYLNPAMVFYTMNNSYIKGTEVERFRITSAGYLKSLPTYGITTGNAANMHIDSNGTFYRSTSSLKYKTDVRDYDKGLNEVMQLQPKYYKGKDDGETQFAGLIAEDIHNLGLTEFVQYADDKTPDALAYPNMIALLTKAIQELKAEIELLKSK